MIYLTAQRVFSRRFRRSSTNTFLHRSDRVLPSSGDAFRLIDEVSQAPGDLIASSVTLPPGGNDVEAYLDFVGNDLQPDTVDEVEGEQGHLLTGASSNEVAWRTQRGAYARFYGHPALDLPQVFVELASAARALLTTRTGNVPFVIVVEREGNAHAYHLDQQSAQRLAGIHETGWHAPRIRVSDDVHRDFESYHGDLKVHLIDMVVGLDRAYVRGLGGVVFREANGRELWRWPAE